MKIIWTPSALWCSGYHYKTSLNKAWTQVLRRLKSCLQHVGDSGWWESLTMVWAGNTFCQSTIPQKKKKKKKKMMNLTYLTCQESNLPYQAHTKGRLPLYHKISGHQHISRKLCNPCSTKVLAKNSCKQNLNTSCADKSAAFLNAFLSASTRLFASFSLSNSLQNLRLTFQYWKASLEIEKTTDFSATLLLKIPMQSTETTSEETLAIAYLMLELLSENGTKLLAMIEQRHVCVYVCIYLPSIIKM